MNDSDEPNDRVGVSVRETLNRKKRCYCALCDGKEFWRLRERKKHGCPMIGQEAEAEQTKNDDDHGGKAEESDHGGKAEESDDNDFDPFLCYSEGEVDEPDDFDFDPFADHAFEFDF